MHVGTLILAATPLGDPRDASARLREVLAGAEVIAAEDTRRLRRLADGLEIPLSGRVLSYFEGNEEARTVELADELRAGRDVVLVTDAGMPSISDPGYRLVDAALAIPARVTCVPGPSAITTALAVSGLPCDRFCFEGFLPRRAGRRRNALAELADERRTMVFLEAPHRLAEMLADAAAVWGADRPAAVCRELTKTYEEVRRGGLGELATWAESGVRGEVTVVVAGAGSGAEPDAAGLAALVEGYVRDGASRRDAIARVAREAGIARNVVYAAATAPPP